MDIERLARDIADSVLGPLAEGGPTKIHSDVAPVVGDAAAEEVVEAVVKIKVRLEEAFEGSPQAARLEQFMSDPHRSIFTVIRYRLRRDEALAFELSRDLYTPNSRTGLSLNEMLRQAETVRIQRESPFEKPNMVEVAARPSLIAGDEVERLLRKERSTDD